MSKQREIPRTWTKSQRSSREGSHVRGIDPPLVGGAAPVDEPNAPGAMSRPSPYRDRGLLLRGAVTAFIASALLTPAVGRSGDVDHKAAGAQARLEAVGLTAEEHPSGLTRLDTSPAEMSWRGAGAFVWHETDVSPETLGLQLRENGFSWVAVLIHDGLAVDPVEGDWVRRFHAASGLPIGGWGVLRTEPEQEADLAHRLLDRYSLDFYIANPEAEYKFSSDHGSSGERFGRSRRFVRAFRAVESDTPAAISSYCRADMQDLDWQVWNDARFVFLPQAYVNDFGNATSPAVCQESAAEFFPASAVHPTVGMYRGQEAGTSPDRYASLLDEAGTVGFSVYLAETGMNPEQWRAFGGAIAELRIARRPGDLPVGLRRAYGRLSTASRE